jgi:hypothetical protein
MIATSGAQLLPEDAVQKLLQDLLPVTTILTPNLPEAKLLLKTANVDFAEPQTPDDLIKMAKDLQKLGPKYVLLKGGHSPLTKDRKISAEQAENDIVFNVLAGPEGVETFETKYLISRNTHGTGCSLACTCTALWPVSFPSTNVIAKPRFHRISLAGCPSLQPCGLGIGMWKLESRQVEILAKATALSITFTQHTLCHLHRKRIRTLSIPDLTSPSGRFIEYLLERKDVIGPWKEHTEHDFVQQMADGTLPVEKFKVYLVQDYLFLVSRL